MSVSTRPFLFTTKCGLRINTIFILKRHEEPTQVKGNYMISRRDALKLGAAGMSATTLRISEDWSSFSTVAAKSSFADWNWAGNAGHTGESHGPGLDFDAPLGVLWRIPYNNERFTGYSNGLFFSDWSEQGWGIEASTISAIDAVNGNLVWTRSTFTQSASNQDITTPQLSADENWFNRLLSISGNNLVIALSDGRLCTLNASNGDVLWDSASRYKWVSEPTVVGEFAYFACSEGICALDLTSTPTVRWTKNLNTANLRLEGLDSGLVYITNADGLIALDTASGDEYWRFPTISRSSMNKWFGVVDGNGFLLDANGDQLLAIDASGELKWSADISEFNSTYNWVLNNTVTGLSSESSNYNQCLFRSLSTETGAPLWEIDIFADRWSSYEGGFVMCAGYAYASISDSYQSQSVLVAVDPASQTVRGLRSNASIRPLIVADGIMIALNDETEEIIAIGTVPGVLQRYSRAEATEDLIIRGGPSDTAIDRGLLSAGTTVTIEDSVTDNDVLWYSVTVSVTGEMGWISSSQLEGLDGELSFEVIDVSEFGLFTSY